VSDGSDDQILRVCGLLSVLAVALVVLSMQFDLADTVLNSVINGTRFVLGVGVAFGAGLVILDRRTAHGQDARGSASTTVIDLRDDVSATTDVPTVR